MMFTAVFFSGGGGVGLEPKAAAFFSFSNSPSRAPSCSSMRP